MDERLVCRRPDDQRKVGNSRYEAAFRDALKSRRCLIPADAFYEWKKFGNTKQPYCFEVAEGKLFVVKS
jgi:putative SOS response-associated peptidase YedK